MDEYDLIDKTCLKLKGEKRKETKQKKKKRKLEPPAGDDSGDHAEHGFWWKTAKFEHIRNDIAIEFLPGCYAKSLSNGRIVLGNLHPPGEAPDEEEIFTAVPAGTNQLAFKSGFDRYLSIDNLNRLVGVSEAIGEAEKFLPVFEDGRTAISSVFNDCFLSVDEDSDVQQIVAKSKKAGPNEMLNIRVNVDPLLRDKSKLG